MRRKVYWYMSVFVATLGAGFLFWGLFFGYTIRLTEAQLQSMVDTHIPTLNEFLAKRSKGEHIERAIVSVNDALTITMVAQGTYLKRDCFVDVTLSGIPRYDSQKHAVYLTLVKDATTLNKFSCSGNSIADRAASLANKYVRDEKLRTLATDLGAWGEEQVLTLSENLAVFSLSHLPVYTFKPNGIGYVAYAFLDSFDIKDGIVTVRLTLVRITMRIVLIGISIVLAIGFMVALARNPEIGNIIPPTGLPFN